MLRHVPPQHRQTVAQLLRFAVSGGLVTALGLGVYAMIAVWWRWNPQLGNFLSYVVAAGVGYLLHSRWSFKGHGESRDHRTVVRFAMVSVISYLLNSFWVWLFTDLLGKPPAVPMLPMLFVTPLVTFMLNRTFVFR